PDAADVAAVEIRGETEFGVVGEPDRLLLVGEAEERRHGAERLLARDRHLRIDVGQHRRLEERAAQRMALAARGDLGALGYGVLDVLLDLLDRLAVDQRALRDAGFQTIADLQLLDRADELLGESVVDLVLYQEAVGADAGLPGVAVLGHDRALDR